MDNSISKAVAEDKKADYYRNKIESMDNNNVISSDDPKVIEKIQAKIDMLEKQKEEVKKREHEWYELPYLNQEIKRLKDRKKELEELEGLNFEDIIFIGGKVIHNKEVNRIQILFDNKPEENIRTILKQYGFKWAKSQGAWQRLYNKNGIKAARYIIDKIQEKED